MKRISNQRRKNLIIMPKNSIRLKGNSKNKNKKYSIMSLKNSPPKDKLKRNNESSIRPRTETHKILKSEMVHNLEKLMNQVLLFPSLLPSPLKPIFPPFRPILPRLKQICPPLKPILFPLRPILPPPSTILPQLITTLPLPPHPTSVKLHPEISANMGYMLCDSQ